MRPPIDLRPLRRFRARLNSVCPAPLTGGSKRACSDADQNALRPIAAGNSLWIEQLPGWRCATPFEQARPRAIVPTGESSKRALLVTGSIM